MDTARQLLPIIMGLSSCAALMLILIVYISTPFTILSVYSSRYNLPVIKSICVEYVCSMWSLLSRPFDHSKDPVIITPRNIFLLVNLIILFLFISMHLQQHASAADKRSARKKRQQHTEKLIMNDKQSTPLQPSEASPLADNVAGSVAAAMASEPLSISSECAAELRSMESFENQIVAVADEASMACMETEAAPMQMNRSLAVMSQGTLTVDSDRINGPDVEKIVLEEDGRLRLIEGPISPKGSDAEKIEDGRLRLIQSTNGSDAEKIVLEKDGRLRLIDRPQLPSSCRPEKSLSYPSDNNRNANYDSHSLNNFNYNNHNFSSDTHTSLDNDQDGLDNHSLNQDNYSNLNEATLITNSNSSLTSKKTIPKPIRVKKSDSLDATWKAINHNKGSAMNANNRDHKHLIRQSSRKDFKPSRGSRVVMKGDPANSRVMRREPSISQDELNAKVESFIAKFNEQIRIERQKSILSYMQMVDRGA